MAFKYLVPPGFESKVRNFPEEAYDVTNTDTHIYKYMWTLLEVGVKFLEIIQQVANDGQSSLANTNFADLDLFDYLGLSRLNEEKYTYDPYMRALPLPTIRELFTKDSLFRTRIIRFANALQRGGSPEGIKLMAEAACGYPCQIYEYWRKDNAVDNYKITMEGAARLKVETEFIVLPLFPINNNQRAVMFHMIGLIQPVHTICSIAQVMTSFLEVDSQWAASSSHFYEAHRRVTADSSIDRRPGGWLIPNTTVDAPMWVLRSTQDYKWSYNADVVSTKAFELTPTYDQLIASVIDPVVISDTEIIVTESITPDPGTFYIKIDDEIILITNREIYEVNTTKFKYTVQRGQFGTLSEEHSDGSLVLTNLQTAAGYLQVKTDNWSDWIQIPLADAPINTGGYGPKFPNDPAKYDSHGHYIYDWESQDKFKAWFVNKIISIGGEVNGNTYRLSSHKLTVPVTLNTPEEALAPPTLRVTPSLYPM